MEHQILYIELYPNSFPVSDIKRTLDAMSWAKINQFHWHVVDSQSFPLQVPGFMELSQKAAYTPSSVYSPSDVSDIISYAAARGIDVLVEIDTPGHTSFIGSAHPGFITCFGASPWTKFASCPLVASSILQIRLLSAIRHLYSKSLWILSSVRAPAREAMQSTSRAMAVIPGRSKR